jgi:hypothetical protein
MDEELKKLRAEFGFKQILKGEDIKPEYRVNPPLRL